MASGAGIRRAPETVGRAGELARLAGAVRAAGAGGTGCALLVGEGGVGKTRLLGEAAALGRGLGLPVLSGRAPITSPVAFSLVSEALRSWLRDHPLPPGSPYDAGLRLVLPEWSGASAGGDATSDLSPGQLRLLALEGVVQLVREIASAHGGMLLLLDDLHAADAESLEAVRYLAAADVAGTALVGALRPHEDGVADALVRGLRDGGADVVLLGGLDPGEVGELVGALLGIRAPDALVADVVRRSAGLPLYVEEVLDAHLTSGSLEVGDAGPVWRGGTTGVPRTIREMVGARLDRIGRPHRDVVTAGAVTGDFDPDLLAAVAATDPAVVHDALADGARVGLLEPVGGNLTFRHALVRDAVLEAALPHLVGLMHRRAAAALEIGPAGDAQTLERRAGHLAALGEHDGAAALLAAASATRLAEHALLDAERLAQAAAARSRGPLASAAAADALARALSAQGRWVEALGVDTATATAYGESAAGRLRMASNALEAGRPDLAYDVIGRARAAGDASVLLDLAAGRTALVGGDGAAAESAARAVLARPVDPDARLGALELLGRAQDFLGERDAAIATWSRQAAEAAAAGRTQAQLRAVVALGKVELFSGQPPVRLHEAVELARAAGALVELSWAQENLAIALAIQGDGQASLAILAEAIPRARRLGLDQLAYLLMAEGSARSFVSEGAEAILDEADTRLPTDDLRLHTAAMRGDIALREGRYDDAVRWLRTCAEIIRTLPGVVPIDSPCWLVWALAAAGRPDEAAAALAEARAMPDLARWYGRPSVVAAAGALLAGSVEEVDAAVTAAPGRMPLDVALMRLLGAEILPGPHAVRWLREALDIYTGAGGTRPAERVRHLLRAAGGPVPRRRRPVAGVPAELASRGVTPRESDVLRLLADGLSNAEIGARLHLSVRTVESHVSALLTKLGARGRGQLTAAALRLGRDSGG